MVGVINNFGGYYKTEFNFHEARMNGGIIEVPCVNRSEHLTRITGNHIYMGFIHLKSLETRLSHEIVAERKRHGPYRSLNDFLTRIDIRLEQLRILIRIGALRFTGKEKQRLLWEGMLYLSGSKTKRTREQLFDTAPKEYPLPRLTRDKAEDAFDEIEMLGFCVCNPFKLLADPERGNALARNLSQDTGKQVRIIGYVVVTKDTSTKTNHLMQFGSFLDCEGNVFDTVHFPDVTRRYPFRGRGFYDIRGKVVEDFGVPTIEVSQMSKCSMVNPRAEQFMIETRDLAPPSS